MLVGEVMAEAIVNPSLPLEAKRRERNARLKRRRVVSLLLGRRVRPVLLLAAAGFLIFGAFRVGLLIGRRNVIEDLHANDVWGCFLMGLRFDAVPIGYALLPLAVVLPLAPRWIFRNRTFRQAVTDLRHHAAGGGPVRGGHRGVLLHALLGPAELADRRAPAALPRSGRVHLARLSRADGAGERGAGDAGGPLGTEQAVLVLPGPIAGAHGGSGSSWPWC